MQNEKENKEKYLRRVMDNPRLDHLTWKSSSYIFNQKKKKFFKLTLSMRIERRYQTPIIRLVLRASYLFLRRKRIPVRIKVSL